MIEIKNISDIQLLKETEDNSVDLIFIDPPFNLKKIYLNYSDDITEKEYLDWQFKILKECKRVLSNRGNLIYHNIPKWCIRISNYLLDIGMIFNNWICWDNAGSIPVPNRLYPKHFSILWFSKSNEKIFNKQYTPIQRCRKCRSTIKDYGGKYNTLKELNGRKVTILSDVWSDIHRIKHKVNKHRNANELPYKLIERIISIYSNEDSLVLDLYLGTGTTAEVCKDYNRNFIGCDISKEDIEIVKNRIISVHKFFF